MKWEADGQYGFYTVQLGRYYLSQSGKATTERDGFLFRFPAEAAAAYANEHGPWPEGHDKCPNTVDWDSAPDDEVNWRICKARGKVSDYTQGGSGLACTMDVIEGFGWQWRHDFGGAWIVRRDAGCINHSSNFSLARALCKALDAREGKV